jgi:uncharacterized Zn finger protein (UPF0148 family)
MIDGTPRPDHGDGWRERVCSRCSASWVGHTTDGPTWCPWCERRAELEQEMERRDLLDPPHLRSDAGSQRYEALDDVDRAIWDRTRGQTRGTDSVAWWAHRLGRAVADGFITQDEADRALRKVLG